MYRLTLLILLNCLCYALHAQLDCNGSIYRVIEKDFEVTTLQKVFIDNENERLSIVDLAAYNGHQLNAICYKPDAQSIYGIKYAEPYQLFRINDDLQLDLLKELPLPTNLSFVAGDIMPDGRHMVVLGFGQQEESNVLAIIDLDDPHFNTELLPLQSVGEEESVVCADIAFHPTTGLLYGFDQRSNKMIRIDIEDRSIELFDKKVANNNIGVVPSMFFDFDGSLYGFSIPSGTQGASQLFEFDKFDGSGEGRFLTDISGSQDACSCPYQVEMYQSINNPNQYSCTEAQFTIKFVNQTPITQTGLSLLDTLPLGMRLKSIDYNPFSSLSPLSTGSSVLSITNFDLPIGVDSLVYTVSIDESMVPGYYQNQSWLVKDNPDIRSNLTAPLPSDDPTTIEFEDATGFIVEGLFEEVDIQDKIICEGDVLTLHARVLGVDSYEWSTGEVSPNIGIEAPGYYTVHLTTSCGQGSVAFDVRGSSLYLDIGDDRVVDKNEPIDLIPEVESSSEIRTILWKESNRRRVMDCYTCLETTARVPESMSFEVIMTNMDGCRSRDEMFVSIEPVKHYFANGFSPNGDGHNDVFFLQSKRDYPFHDFAIYDRWGNQVHHVKEGMMNDPSTGWDGMSRGQALKPAVFVWSVQVLGYDGVLTEHHGDVTLVR